MRLIAFFVFRSRFIVDKSILSYIAINRDIRAQGGTLREEPNVYRAVLIVVKEVLRARRSGAVEV